MLSEPTPTGGSVVFVIFFSSRLPKKPRRNPRTRNKIAPIIAPNTIPALAPVDNFFAGGFGVTLGVALGVGGKPFDAELLKLRGIYTALYAFSGEQQDVVSPQHHFSEVLVPSHGVN